jgi:hypothetical protein
VNRGWSGAREGWRIAVDGKGLSVGPEGHGLGRMGVIWPTASHYFPPRYTSTAIAVSENAVGSPIGIGSLC